MRKMKMKLYEVTFEDGTCLQVVAYDFQGAEYVALVSNRKTPITSIGVKLNVLVYR